MDAPYDINALLRESPRLRELARRIAPDLHAADDLVQDGWLAALRQRPSTQRPLGPWFTSVLTRLAGARRRSAARRAEREHAVARAEAAGAPDEVVVLAEQQRELVGAVLALAEPYRSAILLRYYEGLSPLEIAARSGTPVRTVHTRLARGLAQLRKRLGREARHRADGLAGVLSLRPRSISRASALSGLIAMKTKSACAAVLLALVLGTSAWLGRAPLVGGARSSAAAPKSSAQLARAPASSTGNTSLAGEPAEAASARSVLADVDAELSGRVRSSAGLALPGIEVRARDSSDRLLLGFGLEPSWTPGATAASARTDADGRFCFRLERQHNYDLSFEGAGFAALCLPNHYAGEQLEVVLTREARVRGRVCDEHGAGVAEASVLLFPEGVREPGIAERCAQTDATGQFTFAALPPDAYAWIAAADAHPERFGSIAPLREGETHELEIALTEGRTLRGQITDGSTRAPIAGAVVRLTAFDAAGLGAIADAQGRYELRGVLPMDAAGNSRTRVVVSAPGYGRFDFELPTAAGPAELEQDFFLLPARRAKGRVVDAHGAAVAGASIWANSRARVGEIVQIDELHCVSAADGSFELAPLRADLRHSLLVQARGCALAVFDFPAGEFDASELELGVLRLEPPGAIAGCVLDPSGQPLAEMSVLLEGTPAQRDALGPVEDDGLGYATGEGLGFGRIVARCDARGRFALHGLPAGSYRVMTGNKGIARRAECALELESGHVRGDLVLTLELGLTIEGQVFDFAGHPVVAPFVDLLDARQPWKRITHAMADANGRFRLAGLENGTYGLEARSSVLGATPTLANLRLDSVEAGSRDLRLVLPRAARAQGVVRDADGSARAGIAVSLRRTSGSYEQLTLTDAAGHFEFSAAEGATLTLRFSAQVRADSSGRIDPRYDAEIADVEVGGPPLSVRLPHPPEPR